MRIGTSEATALWLVKEWIGELTCAGMSYSRISLRLNMSPSTIQKIMTTDRFPRLKTIQAIGAYYVKIFENPTHYGSSVEQYFTQHADQICGTLIMTKRLLAQLAAVIENEEDVKIKKI